MNYDYIIVGAGITGSVIASELHKRGYKVLVVEKRGHKGGNMYTELTKDIHVHKYGPHVFHTDSEFIWNYINQFAIFKPYIQETLANYRGEMYNLPFNMNTFNQIFNENSPEKCKEIIANEISQVYKKRPKNLKEQALNLVGPTIFNKLIKGYTEKQWGASCEELDPSIIKRIPLRFEYNNNYFNDKYQGIPIGGYTQIFDNMLKGIDIRFDCDFNKHKEEFRGAKIIHTGMIDEYYNFCYGELEYRSLRFEEQWYPCFQMGKHAVVNYTDAETPWTRIIEHKHFDDTSSKGTILTKEFPAKFEKGMEAYYPINNEKNNKLYAKYAKKAKRDKITFCGRLGSYSYLDMDDAIEHAFAVLKKIVRGR